MGISKDKKYGIETLALHAGQGVDGTMSRGLPLHRTTAYMFRDAQHAKDLFDLKELGFIYTRLGNPTQQALEDRVAAMEGGIGALAFSSGTSAIFSTVINICEHGDGIVAASNLYGGTYTMFNNILPQFGIHTRFADPLDPASFEALIDESTRLVYAETIGNPGLDVVDLEALAEVAHRHNLPLVVDSTFTTPWLLKPLEHGADIVIHSLSKWMGGHGTAIGGIVVDGGKFDWTDEKFTLYNKPDGSYHDLRFARDLGDLNPAAFIIRLRTVPLRNLGACISPDNAWIFLQGIETLPLRMERHCANALAVAAFLEKHPGVSWVKYPGLKSHRGYDTARKYLQNGFGGMVVCGVKGGLEAGARFIEKVELFSHLANVGDAKSLAIHPASTTHSQLSPEAQLEAGVSPDLIRLSVGLETIDDILADLDGALPR